MNELLVIVKNKIKCYKKELIIIENYKNAYKETYMILNNMKSDDVKLIPQEFIKFLKNNMNNNYNFELDMENDFKDQNLLKETKIILAYIFLNYWSTKEQKEKIEQKFRYDIIKEENKKPQYNSKEIFKKI